MHAYGELVLNPFHFRLRWENGNATSACGFFNPQNYVMLLRLLAIKGSTNLRPLNFRFSSLILFYYSVGFSYMYCFVS